MTAASVYLLSLLFWLSTDCGAWAFQLNAVVTSRSPLASFRTNALLLPSGWSTTSSLSFPTRKASSSLAKRGLSFVVPSKNHDIVTQDRHIQHPWWLFATAASDDAVSAVTSTASDDDDDDLGTIFQKIADQDGFISKGSLLQVPEIKELIMDDELLKEEDVNKIWQKYADNNQQRVNFESFVKIYQEIDNLFEDDDEDDDDDDNVESKGAGGGTGEMVSGKKEKASVVESTAGELMEDAETRQELEEIFQIITSMATTIQKESSKTQDEGAQAESSGAAGVLSKEALREWDEIDTLIVDGMLGEEEFEELWERTPKTSDGMVDLNGFLKFNAYIDELFDMEEEDDDDEADDDQDSDSRLKMDEADENLFLAAKSGLVSKEQLLSSWDELKEMLEVGDILPSEFDELYQSALAISRDASALDKKAFDSLRKAIDDLFEEVEEDKEKESANDDTEAVTAAPVTSAKRTDAPSGDATLFQKLAGKSGLVSKEELLNSWQELGEMLRDGDLLPAEFDEIYASSLKRSKDASSLDESAFNALQAAIDDLFEDEDMKESEQQAGTQDNDGGVATSPKRDLLRALAAVNQESSVNESDEARRLPCGLESTEAEAKLILKLANKLMQEDSNILTQTGGNIDTSMVAGSWKLLYTSSSAMKFNKGLSGLGGSFPNGRFGGLVQTLSPSALLPDVEYKERIEVMKPGQSFDVTVNGNWELRQTTSLFTGERSIMIAVDPDRVRYGPTSTKADHWKSLGPTNMLDLVYLDDNLRIMRGSTSMDTIFVFQRIQ
ncbi:hypothetical protein ACA910_017121 [Epithemia clementina (nom. ined.)]